MLAKKFHLRSIRLDLIPFQKEDQELLHKIFTDPFVRKYLWDDQIISIDTVADILEQSQKYFSTDDFGLWKIVTLESNQIVGFTGLWYFFEESQPQLIYGLLPAFTKQGYAVEAAQLIIRYAFEDLGFTYLNAATDAPHIASQRVAERLGMYRLPEKMMDGKPTIFFQIDRPMMA